ncbi:hypothetical protein BOTBODRAFT_191979 [Botryobasidium botryosum FD-172 SS1]|uniref:T6SS Phospholipase effector Tle1-like catalytic domain-containing protein n=1 Tax=Botryobasidium botryosum (strain FD-172 SS1) TaxID=930990 RepID=A0A067LXJ6_BOTB1|nr:hypothetical protein BOTBODRAFT_191979 [Botryobasidium botryosum FD-172 SS1]
MSETASAATETPTLVQVSTPPSPSTTNASTSPQIAPAPAMGDGPLPTNPRRSSEKTSRTESQTKPKSMPQRNLVLCFDGTSNVFGKVNTNVVRLFGVLKGDDEKKQMVYYQTGIGTYADPGITTPPMLSLAKLTDLAVACYLKEHVMGGYRYLMQHYQAGDRIYLFGFSRGAYIARALAGMLHKVGLLQPSMSEQVPFAYKMYAENSQKPKDMNLAAEFKQTFGRNVIVHFVGVWDTVSSVGLFYSRQLPFTTSNESIKYFRHALSLDERRAKFQPSLYDHPIKNNDDTGGGTSQAAKSTAGASSGLDKQGVLEEGRRDEPEPVKEVWFAGEHGDVGGGIEKNGHPALSDHSLRWMIGEAIQAGVLFNQEALDRKNLRPTDKSMEWDARRKVHDQLRRRWGWWLLELIPFTQCRDEKPNMRTRFSPNFGRPRHIHGKSIRVHASVEVRMKNDGAYKVRATHDEDLDFRYEGDTVLLQCEGLESKKLEDERSGGKEVKEEKLGESGAKDGQILPKEVGETGIADGAGDEDNGKTAGDSGTESRAGAGAGAGLVESEGGGKLIQRPKAEDQQVSVYLANQTGLWRRSLGWLIELWWSRLW